MSRKDYLKREGLPAPEPSIFDGADEEFVRPVFEIPHRLEIDLTMADDEPRLLGELRLDNARVRARPPMRPLALSGLQLLEGSPWLNRLPRH